METIQTNNDTEGEDVLTSIDNALAEELAQAEQEREQSARAARAAHTRAVRLGTALRFAGVSILIMAAAAFITQRWVDSSHVTRYGLFLAFTLLVTSAGLFCSRRLNEQKGARAFLGVVLLFIPVHFAQLGALLFSCFGAPPSHASIAYPAFLLWQAPSGPAALLVTALGIGLLMPMAYLAYSVMARSHAGTLMISGFAAAAALLIPTREPAVVTLISALVLGFAVMRDRSVRGFPELRTTEGRIARSVPFIVAATAVARQCALYGAYPLMIGSILVAASAALMLSQRTGAAIGFRRAAIELLALILVIPGWLAMADDIIDAFSVSGRAAGLIASLPLLVILVGYEKRSRSCTALFQIASMVTFGMAVVLQTAGYSGLSASSAGVAIGILGLALSISARSRTLLWTSSITIVASACELIYLASTALDIVSPWIVLGALGIASVLAGSWIERNLSLLSDKLREVHRDIRSWNRQQAQQ